MLLYTINYSDKILLGLVAQPLKEEFGLTSAQIGLAGSLFFFAFAVSGFFAGAINKWMTLKWSLTFLAISWAICMLPMILAASFAVLLVSRILLGFLEGPSGALIHTAAYSWHPLEKRALPGAFISSANSVAKIAVAPALTYVIITYGWHASFIVMMIIGVAWCALWLSTWKEGPYGEKRKKQTTPDTSEPTDTNTDAARVPWTAIFRTPTFLAATAAVIPMYALLTVVLTWLPSYFEKGLGYSRLEAGTMFGFPSIAALVAMFSVSFVSDRLMSRGVSSRLVRGVLPAAGLLICGLSMVVLPYIAAPAMTVVVVSVGYGIGCIVIPVMNAAISQICPKPQLAGTLGTFLALMAIGGVVAPYATGRIVDTAISPAIGYSQSFQAFGVLAVVGAVIAMLFINPARDADRVMAHQKSS
ncbi:MFS transporter [Rhodococcus koreensis]|uniref:MFS transporter n=1 Tax=Rhodococcus koreensis TaxID=99653 RepID=UPI0009349D37|nr:MFS transporter [Rhodococcus koreensis]